MTRLATDATSENTAEWLPRELIAFVRPTPEELRWREIAWETELVIACRAAAETGKPVFLWAMNGNALGCT